MEFNNFFKQYKRNLIHLIEQLDLEQVKEVVDEFNDVELKHGSVYVIGNGGSASTSAHILNDLDIGLRRRDIKKLNIVNLTDNIPSITALANDLDYEDIFFYQIYEKITSTDILLSISCSGNSKNIIKAVKYGKECGATIISFTGFDGGELKKLSDININIEAKKGEYGLVEDLHLIINHMIYSFYLKEKSSVR